MQKITFRKLVGEKYIHHLVRTELVWIHLESTEVFIVCNRPLLPWANAVPPVIHIRKTSPRPADHRRMQLRKRIHKVFSDSMIIRDLRMQLFSV